MAKPSIPQGTRDFGPDVVRKRNYILNTIRNVFELYGFQPLETPAMENIETLMGKYGEEGDKLIFRILDSGNPFSQVFFETLFLYFEATKEFRNWRSENYPHLYTKETSSQIDPNVLAEVCEYMLADKDKGQKWLSNFKFEISGKALRYDLTIPFARYVAMNHTKLTFPFKRYQIQPVWRADRPQKGRYREFYQCDADIVGSNALLNEIELATIYCEVFRNLGIKEFELKINNRKILLALAELCNCPDKMPEIAASIDKLDKIGVDKVKEELYGRWLDKNQVTIIEQYLSISGNNNEILQGLSTLLSNTKSGKKGIEEMSYMLENLKSQTSHIKLDPTLARGLNYYTGTIFEVKAPASIKMGSIGGGGRYDDLTGLFGVPNIPGVGISFGVDRIYDVMEELKLFPEDVHIGTQVLFFNLGEAESKAAFLLAQQLRNKGVRTELYHEVSKFDKQFKYAEKKNIPFVIILGEKELQKGNCNVKNIITGEQQTIPIGELINFKF
jgi:histidyl-tRNA synthetase